MFHIADYIENLYVTQMYLCAVWDFSSLSTLAAAVEAIARLFRKGELAFQNATRQTHISITSKSERITNKSGSHATYSLFNE